MTKTNRDKAKDLLKKTEIMGSEGGNSTLRVWESYQDQALLWRSLALLQIPATLLSLIMAFVFWYTSNPLINVPLRPLPGIYPIQEIPDSEFINVTTEFVNLIASYQPSNARKQYSAAKEMLAEPYLTLFGKEMILSELVAIESTNRTQLFFVDPTKTELKRLDQGLVEVSLTGERLKIIAQEQLPGIVTKYTAKIKIFPRNKLNPYGLLIVGMTSENVRS